MAGFDERFAPPARFAAAMDEAHAVSAREAGDDFGTDDYVPGLKVLLQSMDYDPRFTERGRRIAWGEVIAGLSARARAVKAMKENSGYERGAIVRPLVITGMPRSGTTALHRLMAVDPQFQGLEAWLTGAPMPRPPRETWGENPLFLGAVERLRVRYDAAPESRTAHMMVAEEVDECCLVLRQSFVSYLWTYLWSAPTYDAWWQCQSERAAYRHLAQVLRLIGVREREKRWLLKNPGHIVKLGDLFETFPDALVVQTHRDPAKAIPSLCSLLMHRHPIMEVGRQEERAHILLARETAKWAAAMRDAEPVRQAHEGQMLDVVHGDFHRDPMGVVRRIYAFTGLDLTPAVEAEMARRAREQPERAHGEHRYDIADYGMSEEEVREPFSDYIARFGLAPGRPQ